MISAFERHLGAFTIAFFGVVLTLLVIAVSVVPFCTYDGPSERGQYLTHHGERPIRR